ncbi:MAG: methyltransferase [Sulfurospirillaceae bacterium]|nr:methyltransferase [Sulfurospirillaceae bacterium]MDD2827760.1 methyltransferase [Sulfurospirillaceae bacterium]
MSTNNTMLLNQPEEGYRYNSDTLLLYDFIKSFNPKGSLLDVGCGCGILGLLLKRDFPTLDVHLLDIQEQNYLLSRNNAEQNSIAIESFTCNDYLITKFEDKFDFIVSNPPFYHTGVVKSTNLSLSISRHSSYLPFDKFAHKVTKTLSNKGYFCFCYDAKQLDILMCELLANKLNVEDICFVYPKVDKEASLVLIRARKNSKTLCKIHPPIFMYENENFSTKVQSIFAHSQTKSYTCNHLL